MKLLTFKFNLTILLVFGLALGFGSEALGQSLVNIQIRFANPQFEKSSQTYSLDVEMRSNVADEQLFGINVRFFYDAAMLSFSHLDNFQQGYGILGDTPKAFVGNSNSGSQMFKFYEAAGYVNTAVQLMESKSSVAMGPNKWAKYFTAHFKVHEMELGNEKFAPSVIWDVKSTPKGGGYLKGSDGVVLTLVEKDQATLEESVPASVEGIPFNWVQTSKTSMPFGHPVRGTVLPLLNNKVSSGNPVFDINKPQLLQNQPNPFFEHTKIEFYVPRSAEVKISILDVTGRIIRILEGDYPAGYNAVQVDKDDLNNGADVFFYLLESEDYVSPMKKMLLITK